MSTIRDSGQAQWGLRSQLGATVKQLEDLEGNRDGLVDNESQPAGTTGSAFERNPLSCRAQGVAEVGLSANDERARLAAFVEQAEAKWGEPVLAADVRDEMNGGELFAAQKAIRLTKMGRTPAEVIDGFLTASGRVDGREITDRRIHFTKLAPIGSPSGKVVVVSPGYGETGRTFDEQIAKLNERGHIVVVMDHQWAGQSDGKPGGIDSGYGVARDVAAVTAFAAQAARAELGDDAQVVLFGNSMGGGPGAFGAALLNDAGAIELDGPQMPKGIDLLLQAPFLGATPSVMNTFLQGGAHVPIINRMSVPAAGVPVLTRDDRAAQLGAQDLVREDVRSQLSAFATAQPDIDRMMERVANGERPGGRIALVGNEQDSLADSSRWQDLREALGDQLTVDLQPGTDHVLSQALGDQDRALTALDALLDG